MRQVDDYLDLITSYHRGRPNFVATVAASIQPLADVQVFLAALPEAFDLDEAIGAQLDVVGQWVGRSRNIPIALQNLWFSFDDPPRGFDRGIWKGPYDTGVGITRLDDDTFRRLLYAKIKANTWDGTTAGAQAILDAFFTDPASLIFIEDDGRVGAPEYFFSFDDPLRGFDMGVWLPQSGAATYLPTDMAMIIGVSGKIPSILDLTLLSQNYLPVRPEGVRVTYAITSVDQTPLFGFDVSNEYISGFDSGSWGVSVDYITSHLI